MSSPDTNLANDFLLKEYEMLRTEMSEAVKETRTLERNALIVTGAIWSWLALKENVSYEELKWLPALIVLFSAFRALGLTMFIDEIGNYIATVEKSFITQNELGFERHFKAKKTLKRKSAYFFWIIFFLLTAFIPLFFTTVRSIQ